jgi:hypothetical protein
MSDKNIIPFPKRANESTKTIPPLGNFEKLSHALSIEDQAKIVCLESIRRLRLRLGKISPNLLENSNLTVIPTKQSIPDIILLLSGFAKMSDQELLTQAVQLEIMSIFACMSNDLHS